MCCRNQCSHLHRKPIFVSDSEKNNFFLILFLHLFYALKLLTLMTNFPIHFLNHRTDDTDICSYIQRTFKKLFNSFGFQMLYFFPNFLLSIYISSVNNSVYLFAHGFLNIWFGVKWNLFSIFKAKFILEVMETITALSLSRVLFFPFSKYIQVEN